MIEMGKQYRTRGGRKVRIYAVDSRGTHPVHGAVLCTDKNRWSVDIWTASGKRSDGYDDQQDLIEVKPRIKRTVWLNVYSDPGLNGGYYATRASADSMAAGSTRLACISIEIDCEEGEGL